MHRVRAQFLAKHSLLTPHVLVELDGKEIRGVSAYESRQDFENGCAEITITFTTSSDLVEEVLIDEED